MVNSIADSPPHSPRLHLLQPLPSRSPRLFNLPLRSVFHLQHPSSAVYLPASSRHVSCHPLHPQLLSRPHRRPALHPSLLSRSSTRLLRLFERTSQTRYDDQAIRVRPITYPISAHGRVRRLQVVGGGCRTDAAGGGLWVAGQWAVDPGGSMVRLVAGMAGRGRDCESVIVKLGCWMEKKKHRLAH